MTDDIIHKETENFKIELKQPRITGKGIYAKVETNYKGNDFPPYDAEVKMTGTSVSGYAGDIIDMNGLTENADDLRVEIKKAVLPEKKQLREIAKRKEGEDGEEDVPQTSSALDKLLKTIFVQEKPKVDELEDGDHPEVRRLCEENEDLILRSSGKLVLTEKGTKKAKEALGFDKFEGDVQEEAEKQLKNNPLNYYLQAFNKVHKGDPLLKIWQLESAVSSVLDERQIHSWGAGPSGKGKSVSGDTPVFVQKQDGWHIQSIRQLSQEYEGQDWYTVGLNSNTLEAERTPIKDVLAHRNQRKMVDIETRSGRQITGTMDHSFLKQQNGEIAPATGEELEEGDYIPVVKNHQFDRKDTDFLPEKLGFLTGIYLAEGRKQSKKRIHITNFDTEIRKEIKTVCEELGLDYELIRGEDFSIDIEKHREIFEKAKTGSGQKIVPPKAFTQTQKFQKQLLKGYFAGDGITGEQPGYVTKSKDLGLGISLMLSQYGIVTTHREKKRNGRKYYRHRITKPASEKNFYEKIGFKREKDEKFEERDTQLYVDRVPVDNQKVKNFLACNQQSKSSGRNRILRNDNVKENGEIGREKLREALEMYDYETKTPYIKQLENQLDSNVMWDKIEKIEEENEKKRHRVYDIEAGRETPHFLCANGVVVHNSHINRNTLKFIPEEYYAKKNSISPKSMLYKADKQGTDFLNNQIIFFDEVDDIDEDTVVLLRSMTDQDEDVIEHEMVRDQNFEKLVLETGSVTVWFTSVETINDEQLKNRFIITNPDGSADLDNQVFNHQLKRLHKGKELDFVPKEAPVVKEMVKDVMQETQDYKVIIPFRTVWKQKFNRRLYPYFVTSIRMITKLHYRNRETRDGYMFATKGDFKLAALVWERLVDTTVAQQDREALRLLEHLPESSENAMSSAELSMRVDGFSSGKVRRKAKQLQETEELNLINTSRENGRYQYWAGEDKQKLVDNEPEIEISEEIVEDMLPDEYEDDEDVKDSVLNTEIEIYDMLLKKFEEAQERRNLNDEEVDVELTDDENHLISQCKEYDWDATVDTLDRMSADLDDIWEPIESLEQKGLIRLDEEKEGELKPRPTSKMDKLKEQQSVGL